jgi:hypothetical protein
MTSDAPNTSYSLLSQSSNSSQGCKSVSLLLREKFALFLVFLFFLFASFLFFGGLLLFGRAPKTSRPHPTALRRGLLLFLLLSLGLLCCIFLVYALLLFPLFSLTPFADSFLGGSFFLGCRFNSPSPKGAQHTNNFRLLLLLLPFNWWIVVERDEVFDYVLC